MNVMQNSYLGQVGAARGFGQCGAPEAWLSRFRFPLMSMAEIIGIPPKAISLNGELGLAFGARGSGGIDPATAHYERDHVVLT